MSEAQPEATSFGHRITQLAAHKPRESALTFVATSGEVRRYTWAELETRSLQIAQLLRKNGVGQGSFVIVGLPNSPEHFFATLAAWKLGACVLPLRWDLPDWERERLIEVAKPQVAIGAWDGASLALADLQGTEALDPEPLPDCVPDPARAIASSGSTGRPKIIVKTGPGEAVLGENEGLVQRDPNATRVELVPAPLYHTNGFMLAHNALFIGDHIIVMERFDAAQAVGLIERYRVTHVTMVPIMLLRIARLPDLAERDLSSLEAVLQGGAPIPPWLVRFWIDIVGPEGFSMSYGSTENVGAAMIRGDEWLEHPGSVGRGHETDIQILDENGAELPPGEVGEIYMRKPANEELPFRYIGAPDPKQSAGGFTSIGDLGWLDADGYLYIADRRVDMVISGGANIFPAEVEAVVLEHPGVIDAAVIGLPDDEWGQRVHAVVQPRDPEQPPSFDDLKAHCRERLAAYKVPKGFEVIERLPRTDAGKLNRSRLVEERAG